jgi:hypothetical protein
MEKQIVKVISLGIQEEIFDDFFAKLKEAKLPEDLLRDLKVLLESGEVTKEGILEAIKRRGKVGDNYQEH